jgi:hypothetical protein
MAGVDTITAPTALPGGAAGLSSLFTADAVRQRCRMVHRFVADGRSPHFALDESRLAAVADYVAEVTRAAYPDRHVPPHSRFRHFTAGGVDRWASLARSLDGATPMERARTAADLATVSVLLDAGAGHAWSYREPATGQAFARSEGLAVASIDMFAAGAFSSRPDKPLQVDAAALIGLDRDRLARGFQLRADNPLVGLDGRLVLLRRLGQTLAAQPRLFGPDGRPGFLIDRFARGAHDGRVSAPKLLATLLPSLAPIWPSGLVRDGVNIGDAGLHPAVQTSDATDGIVPFHKLSQWLACSLIEPLAMAGLVVTDLDGLTALAEYRNGGLLIDLGVIRPRRPIEKPQPLDSEFAVEWRALTVALIDDLLGPVRRRLGVGAEFSLPQLLQGGTWSAGRKIAQELRPPHGPPPIPLAADGTIF